MWLAEKLDWKGLKARKHRRIFTILDMKIMPLKVTEIHCFLISCPRYEYGILTNFGGGGTPSSLRARPWCDLWQRLW
jgi:hypothetical protein